MVPADRCPGNRDPSLPSPPGSLGWLLGGAKRAVSDQAGCERAPSRLQTPPRPHQRRHTHGRAKTQRPKSREVDPVLINFGIPSVESVRPIHPQPTKACPLPRPLTPNHSAEKKIPSRASHLFLPPPSLFSPSLALSSFFFSPSHSQLFSSHPIPSSSPSLLSLLQDLGFLSNPFTMADDVSSIPCLLRFPRSRRTRPRISALAPIFRLAKSTPHCDSCPTIQYSLEAALHQPSASHRRRALFHLGHRCHLWSRILLIAVFFCSAAP